MESKRHCEKSLTKKKKQLKLKPIFYDRHHRKPALLYLLHRALSILEKQLITIVLGV